TASGSSEGRMAPRRASASDARRCCIAWRSSASRGSHRDAMPQPPETPGCTITVRGLMGKTEDLIRYRANLQGEIDSAALYRMLAEVEVQSMNARMRVFSASLPTIHGRA